MHTYHQTVSTKRNLTRIPQSEAFRILLILAIFVATSIGLSAFAKDPGIAAQPSTQAAGIEDWHGNVARSGR